MILVTVATIGLAVQQDESSLAIIGTIGGLGTPFLLYSAAGSVGGLAAYTCTVLAVACAIFFAQGWRSLLYTTVAGGWVVFLVTAVRAGEIGERPPDVWALQVGIAGAWVLLAGTPVVRALFRQTHPDGWPGSPLPSWIDRLVGRNRPVYGLVTVSTLLQFLDPQTVFKFLHVYTARVGETDGFGVYTITDDAHDAQTLNTILGQFDAVIRLRENDAGEREAQVRGDGVSPTAWLPFPYGE
jgi:hypothetical protein